MIVIADTTPINYLILIGEIHVLEQLYGRIVLPSAVRDELLHPKAPMKVKEWITELPDWVEVRSASPVHDANLDRLDKGEREAIALAIDLAADYLIVDEMAGRREAERLGFSVIGTLGVIGDAAVEGLLDLHAAVERLRRTSFHISPAILASLLGE